MKQLGRQVGFDEDFEGVAALLFRRKVRDALFEVDELNDVVEEVSLEV